MLWYLAYFVAGVVSLKFLVNFAKYRSLKRYLAAYQAYLEEPTYEFAQKKSRILKLMQGAGVQDSYVTHVELVMPGRVKTVPNVSVLQNIQQSRPDIVANVTLKFHEAIGEYQARYKEALDPIYWITFIFSLPERMLGYLGLPKGGTLSLVLKLLWLVITLLVIPIVLTAYGTETTQFVKDTVKKVLP